MRRVDNIVRLELPQKDIGEFFLNTYYMDIMIVYSNAQTKDKNQTPYTALSPVYMRTRHVDNLQLHEMLTIHVQLHFSLLKTTNIITSLVSYVLYI